MLPSMGYFSAIPCVFYLAGNCERPHCHYRHCVKDKTANDDVAYTSVSSEDAADWFGPNLSVSMVTSMVEKLVDKIFVEEPEKTRKLDRDHVVREALHRLKKEAILKKTNSHLSTSTTASLGIPSYKPTPISELNKRHIPVVYAPAKPQMMVRHDKAVDEKQLFRPSPPHPLFVKSLANDHGTFSESNPVVDAINSITINDIINNDPTSSSLSDKNDLVLHTIPVSFDNASFVPVENIMKLSPNHINNSYSMEESNILHKDINVEPEEPLEIESSEQALLEMDGTGGEFLSDKPPCEKQSDFHYKKEVSSEAFCTSKNTSNQFGETDSLKSVIKNLQESISSDNCHENSLNSKSTDNIKGSKKTCSSKHSSNEKNKKLATKDKQSKKSSSHKDKCDSIKSSKHSNDRSLHSSSTLDTNSSDSKSLAKIIKKSNEKGSSSLPSDPKKHNEKSKEKKKEKNRNHKTHDNLSKKTDNLVNPNPSDLVFDKLIGKTDHKPASVTSKDKSVVRSHRCKSASVHSTVISSNTSSKKQSRAENPEPPLKKPKLETEWRNKIHQRSSKCASEKQNADKSSSSADHRKVNSAAPKRSLREALMDNESRKKTKVSHEGSHAENGHEATAISETVNSAAPKRSVPERFVDNESRKVKVPRKDSHAENGHKTTAILETGSEEENYDSISGPSESDAISISSDSSSSAHLDSLGPNEPSPSVLVKVNDAGDEAGDCVPDTRWSKAKEIIQKSSNTKVRIAHVPNVSNILSAKTKILAKASTVPTRVEKPVSSVDDPQPTLLRRIAHASENAAKKGVTVATHADAGKVPFSIRHQYCTALFMELKKWISVDDALKKAEVEELDIAKKANSVQIYKNRCSLLLLKIRKSHGSLNEDDSKQETRKEIHATSSPDYTYGWSLYKCFSKYLLSDEELVQNGYPMPLPGQKNCAYIEKTARRFSIQQPDEPHTKICSNCGKRFEIDDAGMPTTINNCFYHWGKLRRMRVMGQFTEKFTCCDGADDAVPCQSATYHVWSGCNEDCIPGYVKTREFPLERDESLAGIYALDCEMCYTTRGLELARLTVVDLNEEIVFDQVVAMDNPILDYCTRFSGIDEEKILNATHTFSDVRKWVLENIFDKTILVGHSLENDLKALKIFHKSVVDTSVVFPHKFGPPLKCSLKYLATSVLSLTIQDSDSGHDSKEDALTCLKLIMVKLKEDAKARKPRFIIGFSGKKK